MTNTAQTRPPAASAQRPKRPAGQKPGRAGVARREALVTVESQREVDLLTGAQVERTFVKLYVAARRSGLLAAISDRDWKTLCTLATYMDADGYCFPSQAELARAMGCSRQMANERIRNLAAFRFRGPGRLLVVKGAAQRPGHVGPQRLPGAAPLPAAHLRPAREAEPSETKPRRGPCQDRLTRGRTGTVPCQGRPARRRLDTSRATLWNQNHIFRSFERMSTETGTGDRTWAVSRPRRRRCRPGLPTSAR